MQDVNNSQLVSQAEVVLNKQEINSIINVKNIKVRDFIVSVDRVPNSSKFN
jgi:hypothetical protein